MKSHDAYDLPVILAEDERTVTLRELSGGQPLLLVLARHMDCPFCEVHLGRVMRSRDDIGRVVVVGHGQPQELREHHTNLPPEVVLVADPDHSLYKAFSAKRLRSALHMMIKPTSIPTIVMHLVHGGKLIRAGQDILQLGADVVLDTDGNACWKHLSKRPDDRPPLGIVAQQMHNAA